MNQWDQSQPIYLQLRQLVARQILVGALPEGEAIPSVRSVAAQERINPLTVTRAYQLLVDAGLVEKRRGLGMFVVAGAQQLALEQERQQFLAHEWPEIRARIDELGLEVSELLGQPNPESNPHLTSHLTPESKP